MTHHNSENNGKGKVALLTGAARRVGAVVAKKLHQEGMNLVIHYNSSDQDAKKLKEELLNLRDDSIDIVQGELSSSGSWEQIVAFAAQRWGRLDVLVNNASAFHISSKYPLWLRQETFGPRKTCCCTSGAYRFVDKTETINPFNQNADIIK